LNKAMNIEKGNSVIAFKHIGQPSTFLGISSFQIIAMFRRGLFYCYLSIYLRHYLGLSVTETTLLATLPMLSNILFQTFIWGNISDKYQLRRTLIIVGELMAAMGTIVVWYCHTLSEDGIISGYVIILGLTVVEAFWSMSNIGWSALISDIYEEKDRSAIQGQLSSMGGLGRILGIWIGGLLYDGLGQFYPGWGFEKGILFFVAAGAMIISVLPLRLLPEGGIGNQATQFGFNPGQNMPLLSSNSNEFLLFLTAMIFINFGRNSIAVIQTQYLVLESGLAVNSQVLSYIVNTQSVAMVITGFMTGWITTRLGDEKALILGTISAIVALIIIGTSLNLTLIYISNFIRGFSEVLIMAASYTVASVLIPPSSRGRLFAIFNATFFLSWGLAGTLIAGPIVDYLRVNGYSEAISYQYSFLSAAALTSVGAALWIRQSMQKRYSPAI
jgi:MFS family permease